VNDTKETQRFNILRNPVSEVTESEMKAQFDFINDINKKMTEIHQALKNVQKIRGQIGVLKKAVKDTETHKALLEFADALVKDMTKIEEALYQTKSKSGQDPLNFPIRLNNKLAHLNSLTRIGNYAPTQQAIDFKNDIVKDIDLKLKNLYSLFDTSIKELNQKVKESNIDLIQLD
jgi:oligoendopeptidase F